MSEIALKTRQYISRAFQCLHKAFVNTFGTCQLQIWVSWRAPPVPAKRGKKLRLSRRSVWKRWHWTHGLWRESGRLVWLSPVRVRAYKIRRSIGCRVEPIDPSCVQHVAYVTAGVLAVPYYARVCRCHAHTVPGRTRRVDPCMRCARTHGGWFAKNRVVFQENS